MRPVLSVLVDHVDAGIAELRSCMTASGPLTPGERVGAVREIAAAAAAVAKLRKVLAHAEERQGEEMARTSEGACHARP